MRACLILAASVLVTVHLPFCLSGQVTVDGSVINQYSGVRTVYHSSPDDADSVAVMNPELFHPGDTCLFYIAKGAEIYNSLDFPDFPILWGKIMNMNNAGIYAILIVRSVADSLVVFTAPLPPMIQSARSEAIQLVRVRTADRLVIDRPLSCAGWDPETGTGGILALIANYSITIHSTVDVTGKGYIGGQPDPVAFGDSCKMVTAGSYMAGAADSAGNKGESVVYREYPYTRGKISSATGGGGGNGRFSGGGGGSNYGQGGSGGKESEACSPAENQGGRSNYLNPGYFNNIGGFKNRVYMGGGGGTSTQDLPARVSTAGGNGGGIVILITDSLICPEGDTLSANGQSVTDTATAGAGGGGGGGIIVIDADHYSGNLHLEVKGGNGGATNDPEFITGPGGFGGAGLLWFTGEYLPAGITIDTMDGLAGLHIPTGLHYGATTSQSRNGDLMTGLVSPLKGFLFNNISTVHTVCSDETGIVIRGSHPKGGDGTYTFLWEISADRQSWSKAPGYHDQKDYLTGATDDNRYFRRIVVSGEMTDTSRVIHFRHYPPLSSNIIEGGGTVCSDVMAGPIVQGALPLTGGTGYYSFSWQQYSLPSGWTASGGINNELTYSSSFLSGTTLFRRIVISGECEDTSNTVRFDVRHALQITVHPADVTAGAGEQAVFSVSATGTPPISYQWYHNEQPVPGATDDIHIISQITGADVGTYFCRSSNVCGEVQSNTASLVITGMMNPAQSPGTIYVFPNPVKDQIYIEQQITGPFEVHLYDLLGNRHGIWQQPNIIGVSDLAPGFYLLKFLDDKKQMITVIRIEVYR